MANLSRALPIGTTGYTLFITLKMAMIISRFSLSNAITEQRCLLSSLLIFAVSLAGTALLLAILQRILPDDFLAATVNNRSNHNQPARQIGGIAITPVLLSIIIVMAMTGQLPALPIFFLVLAILLLWFIGLADDSRHLGVRIRFAAQLISASLLLLALTSSFRLWPDLLPLWPERILLCIALVGSINTTNFMDGLDWLTVSGIGIPLLLTGLITSFLHPDLFISSLSLAMSGTLAGFALFNRPPARIFLGDSGSLPIGAITGLIFILFAGHTGFIPALILPLYYIADAGSTIAIRLCKGENILQAHSSHAYQKAKRAGMSVHTITSRIALLNLTLGGLAAVAVIYPYPVLQSSLMLLALSLTVGLLYSFRQHS